LKEILEWYTSNDTFQSLAMDFGEEDQHRQAAAVLASKKLDGSQDEDDLEGLRAQALFLGKSTTTVFAIKKSSIARSA
jgi:hypothetical protein